MCVKTVYVLYVYACPLYVLVHTRNHSPTSYHGIKYSELGHVCAHIYQDSGFSLDMLATGPSDLIREVPLFQR